ncbi:MAG: tetratricopeptide repeat protein [Candidatus Omnitrophica bacterium]|nr:tetratricopeptide repeat protein [Candidatus Omnitrophota bacterium]
MLFVKVFFIGAVLIFPLGMGGCAELTGIEEPANSPKKPTELYNQALAVYQEGKYAEAKERFHEFLGQYPQSPLFKVALYYLGHCHQMLGDQKEALTFYNRVITTYGDEDFWSVQAAKRIKQMKPDPLP